MKWYEASEWIKNIPLSRYIASYYIGGGIPKFQLVKKWAKSLVINGEHLNNEEITIIAEAICNGMVQLESHTEKFMKDYKEEYWF